MSRARALLASVSAVCALTLVSGCGPTMADLPLPGGDVSGDTVAVNAEFNDVLNLTTGALVKVNGIDAGKVMDIQTKDFKAVIKMKVRQDAQIRQGARARLRYTTPLGEVFVDVTNAPSGQVLADGSTLKLNSTETAPTVEDALSQASLLINGGGLNQLQTITEELNTALDGRSGRVRDVLGRTDNLMQQFNSTSGEIDRTLKALNSVSGTLSARRQTIHTALKEIEPAARALRSNLPGLTKLLAQLESFSGTSNQLVRATRDQIRVLLSEAAPTLAQFASLRPTFRATLRDIVDLGNNINQVVPGDYLNMGIHLDAASILGGGTAPAAAGTTTNPLTLPKLNVPKTQLPIIENLLGGGQQPKPKTSQPPQGGGLLGGIGNLLGGGR